MWNPTKNFLDATQSQNMAEYGPKKPKIATTAKKTKKSENKNFTK